MRTTVLLNASFLDGVAGHVVDHRRYFDAATLIGVRAARMEGAAWRRRERIWHFDRDRGARLAAHGEIRHGVEQHARVRVARAREELRGRRELHDAPAIHDA